MSGEDTLWSPVDNTEFEKAFNMLSNTSTTENISCGPVLPHLDFNFTFFILNMKMGMDDQQDSLEDKEIN